MAMYTYVGIVFEELAADDISYKIRLRHEVGFENSWNTDFLGPNFEAPGPRIANKYVGYCNHCFFNLWLLPSHLSPPPLPLPLLPPLPPSSYLSEGFLHLQQLVGAAIIEWKSGEDMNISVSVRVCKNA